MNISMGNPQYGELVMMVQELQRNLRNSKQVQRDIAEAVHIQSQMLAALQKVGEDTRAGVIEVSDKQTQQLDSITGKSFFELTWAQTPEWLKLKMKQAAGKAVVKTGEFAMGQTVGRYLDGAKLALGPINAILNVTIFVVVTATGLFMLYNMGPAVYQAAGVTVQEGLNQIFHIVKPLLETLRSEFTAALLTSVGHLDIYRRSYCAGLPWTYQSAAKYLKLCPW